MADREEALKFFQNELEKEWDKWVEEAKKSLNQEEEDYIVYRLALLMFTLRRIPPVHNPQFKTFRKEIKYFI